MTSFHDKNECKEKNSNNTKCNYFISLQKNWNDNCCFITSETCFIFSNVELQEGSKNKLLNYAREVQYGSEDTLS